ncbi:reverse transcriptase domain-containing protein [Thiolapillus sp.]|uniref:reverse transcriptase domain-containing protein n=2 Tax=Thiolapillus sp. TaxID=2017437 RepID=UPI003AF411B6
MTKDWQASEQEGSTTSAPILSKPSQTSMTRPLVVVLFNNSAGDWFQTIVGVRQGCLLSPTLFNTFLERIMTDALEDHEGTVSIGGRTITNLRFVDDIEGLAGKELEMAKLVEYLDKDSTAYGMEISDEKTKLMTNNTTGILTEIKVNG